MNRIATELDAPILVELEAEPGLAADLMTLVKVRLTTLVLITTLIGFCMAAKGGIDFIRLLYTLLGTALVAAASQAFNQVIETRVDGLMERTKDRPLPSGRISRRHAFLLAAVMAVAGFLVLLNAVNRSSACMAVATMAVYLGVYTPLKKHTPLCITFGAVAGAIPPVIGWMAARPVLDAGAWILFAMLFFWQMPHFIAIAWMYRDDYARAGLVMLRRGDTGGRAAALESFLCTLALASASLAPVALKMTGPFYLPGAILLDAVMLVCAARFLANRSRAGARRLFFASIFTLPVLLGLLLIAKA